MVSLRRRRLLGLCSGKHSFSIGIPKFFENNTFVESRNQNIRPSSVHPLPAVIIDHQKLISEECVESTTVIKEEVDHYFQDKKIKHRKNYRRKQYKDQEPPIMRGVYFKNTKWQAAIKVDKKQIHLGTVGSQEEAAKLYDRAAYICGRRPNFELSEEEKQELSRYKWEEFLEITRNSISSKKHQRRQGGGRKKMNENNLQCNNLESM
ncbi:ethylene-responsive transcription factor-like protein At4g13040 [Dioscorea cayenensis subsp. rotundata]|uniref:Ethylene-responsive transcription factor-like protein At4g13040 n=1 Tax=Dioscorea cayennensis subsp. rotundata TaxID=55577 RepID=A0AB40B3F0_DIOCR|nr:ethylene-responsive transcription factor-like protein At4g13040 [Dioscorea cayenensis subsp. rotundata]